MSQLHMQSCYMLHSTLAAFCTEKIHATPAQVIHHITRYAKKHQLFDGARVHLDDCLRTALCVPHPYGVNKMNLETLKSCLERTMLPMKLDDPYIKTALAAKVPINVVVTCENAVFVLSGDGIVYTLFLTTKQADCDDKITPSFVGTMKETVCNMKPWCVALVFGSELQVSTKDMLVRAGFMLVNKYYAWMN